MRDYLLQFNVNLYPNTEFKQGFARVKESATGLMQLNNEWNVRLETFPP